MPFLSSQVYRLVVRASSPPLRTDVPVEIHVTDVNDNAPEFQDFRVVFNNFLNYFPTGPIGRVPAFDADVSDQVSFVYSSLSGLPCRADEFIRVCLLPRAVPSICLITVASERNLQTIFSGQGRNNKIVRHLHTRSFYFSGKKAVRTFRGDRFSRAVFVMA